MLANRTGIACPAAQPNACVLAASTRCTRCRRPFPRSERWCVRASKDGGNDDRGVNWDAAWSEFKSTAKKGIPETESRKAPSFSRRPRRTPLQEQIRKQEDFVLDFWSSETVFKVGGVFVVAFMAFILVTALQSS